MKGPLTIWRCPLCEHEWQTQTTAGAEYASFEIKPCSCPSTPEIVALDGLTTASFTGTELDS